MQSALYRAVLIDRMGLQSDQDFVRLSDAIVWLSGELNAGHGHFLYGEVWCEDRLLWKRGVRPVAAAAGSLRV